MFQEDHSCRDSHIGREFSAVCWCWGVHHPLAKIEKDRAELIAFL
jgi:hypothetical protein